MATFTLAADVRSKDESAKKINQNKKLAGVVYGKHQEPISLTLGASEFLRTYRKAGESQIINLTVGKKDIEVVIHDTQKDPVTGDFIHVDLYALTQGEKLNAKIHLSFVGESQAVRDGALLQEMVKEIEVSCLPKDLVESFEADLSKLEKVGDTITVADLGIDSEKYDIHHLHGDDAVAVVSEVRAQSVDEDEETAEGSEEASESEGSEEASEEK